MSEHVSEIAIDAVQASTEAVAEAEHHAEEAAEASASAAEHAANAGEAVAAVVPAAAEASAEVIAQALAPLMDRLDSIEARIDALGEHAGVKPGEGASGQDDGVVGTGETVVNEAVDTVENTGSLAVVGVEETATAPRKVASRFYRI